jgi:hypothetical protein
MEMVPLWQPIPPVLTLSFRQYLMKKSARDLLFFVGNINERMYISFDSKVMLDSSKLSEMSKVNLH